MIANLLTDALGDRLEADVCIIGAGPAGITLALELSARGASVVLAESGGLELEADVQDFSNGVCAGHPMGMEDGRFRVLGGASSQWTGRCITLDPIDFEQRPWVAHSGWPIAREQVAQYHGRAARYCGFAEDWAPDEAIPDALGFEAPAFDDDKAKLSFWRYAPQNGLRRYRDWGRDYRAEMRRRDNLRVVLSANAVGFEFSANGRRVDSVELAALSGRRTRVRASAIVLCCGGAENARLLLSAAEDSPSALHDVADMVGRFFMQHPRGRIARVIADAAQSKKLQDVFNVFSRREGVQYEVGFALSEAVQRREQLLNCSAILTYEADPRSAWARLKRAASGASGDRLGDVAAAVQAPGEILNNLWRRAGQGRHSLLKTRSIDVIVDLEQAPNSDSRLRLAESRDGLGMRRLRSEWRIGEQERATATRFAQLLQGEFTRLGLGEMELEPWAQAGEPMPAGALAGTYHHIGTTRMSSHAGAGVVDSDCKVHGMDNLFVQSAGAFSTGGHANPTLTIVALALRQADALERKLASRAAG